MKYLACELCTNDIIEFACDHLSGDHGLACTACALYAKSKGYRIRQIINCRYVAWA